MKNRIRTRAVYRIVAILAAAPLLLASACSSSEKQDPAGPTDPQNTGNVVFVIPGDESAEISGLDPMQANGSGAHNVWGALYSTLFTQDPESGELVGGLAKDWKVSDDGLEWTLNLRDDVVFHNGDKFTSEDVIFSLDRVRDDQYMPANAYASGLLSNVKGWSADGPYVVKLSLDAPQSNLGTSALGRTHLSIVPRQYFEKVGAKEFGENPVGTGPFKFDSWKRSEKISLKRNEDFKWGPSYSKTAGGPARLETLAFKYISDPSTRISSYLAEEVDIIQDVDFTDLPRLQADKNTEVQLVEKNGTTSQLDLNTETGPTSNVDVRRAISASIDREQLVSAAFGETATVSCQFLPGKMGAFVNEDACVPEYDADLAAKLLDEQGWEVGKDGTRAKDGKPLTLVGLVDSQYAKIMELLQAQLRRVGIDMRVQAKSYAALQDLVSSSEGWSLYLAKPGGRTNEDPNILRSSWISSAIPPQGDFNYARFSSPELDDLLNRGLSEQGLDKRVKIYHEVQDILAEEVPAIPYASAKVVRVHRSSVHDLVADIRGSYSYFFDMWKED